ncbi:MAG TPA: hypothetical protein VNS02_08025 [Rhizobiaceae bacterium]|nr:hypothetical protein [Rhizobiaceae bacterium]
MRDFDPKRAAILLAPIVVAILTLAVAGLVIEDHRMVDNVWTSSTTR